MEKYLMKKHLVTLAMTLLVSAIYSGNVMAGDCKAVKQKFTNGLDVRIKVKKSVITGNDGTWTENFSNHKIDAGESWTTNKRRFNKLDSGHKPNPLVVYYDKWDSNNSKWRARTKSFPNLQKCFDNKTYKLTIN